MNKITAILLTICINPMLFSQQKEIKLEGAIINSKSTITNLPQQVSFYESKHLKDTQFSTWLLKELINTPECTLKLEKEERDELGFKHDRYIQYFKSYPIEGTLIIAHGKNSEIRNFNGDYYRDISPANSISLNEKKALRAAIKKVNSKKYKWENEEEEKELKKIFNHPDFSNKKATELVVLPTVDESRKTILYNYAYKFNSSTEGSPAKFNIFIDASSGKILRSDNLILNGRNAGQTNVPGSH